MTAHRFSHTLAQPTLVSGDDRPARPCADPLNREVFEATIDHSSGHTYTQAVAEAREICLTGCDFAARKACYRENKDGAGVIAALTLLERQGRPETVERETCGTTAGATAHYKHQETPCEACKAAQAAKKRARAVAVCGSDSGYYRHLRVTKTVPCDECKKAHALMLQMRKARKKKEAAA